MATDVCTFGTNQLSRCLHIWHKPVKQMFAHLAQASAAAVCPNKIPIMTVLEVELPTFD